MPGEGEDQLADGRIEIVEVKDEFEAAKDPDYSSKLNYFGEVYERLGWSFRLTTRDQIKDPATFETVEAVQRYRRASFTPTEVADVRHRMGQHGECTLGELLPLFSSELEGLPKLCAMMVGRILVLDVRSKLEPASANPRLNGVLVSADEKTGRATSVTRLSYSEQDLAALASNAKAESRIPNPESRLASPTK